MPAQTTVATTTPATTADASSIGDANERSDPLLAFAGARDAAEAFAVAAGLDPTAASANASAADAVRRAAAACDAIVAAAASADEAIVALDTVRVLLSNAADAPRGDAGEKYRRVRVANPAFRRRAGRFPGAMDALRAAGFRDDATDGEPSLRLTRDDPALLYVVRSTVADAAERARRKA